MFFAFKGTCCQSEAPVIQLRAMEGYDIFLEGIGVFPVHILARAGGSFDLQGLTLTRECSTFLNCSIRNSQLSHLLIAVLFMHISFSSELLIRRTIVKSIWYAAYHIERVVGRVESTANSQSTNNNNHLVT